MMCVRQSRLGEPGRPIVKSLTAPTRKERETDHRCSDIPPDILRALDAEVAMLTSQMDTFSVKSPTILTSGLTPNSQISDGMATQENSNIFQSPRESGSRIDDILRETDMSDITGHARHFDIDLEVAEITGAFKPSGFRLGNMAARFKSGYLIEIDDGFDRSLPFRHFRNRYGNAASLVNTPVAKGFFPIKDSCGKHSDEKRGNVTSPSILKPKARRILSPLPVSLKDKMAVDKIIGRAQPVGTTSPHGHVTVVPCHGTQGSDHDSGRSSGQSSEEKTSLDEEPYSISDGKTISSPKLVRKQTRQKRASKGARKENLARFFRSFKLSSSSSQSSDHSRTDSIDSSVLSDVDEETAPPVEEPNTDHILPQEIACATNFEKQDSLTSTPPPTRAKKVTFDLSATVEMCDDVNYESDGFFSDDDDDDSSSCTGSTSSYSSWSSSCSTCCCSCCSCSSCSTCYSEVTVTTLQTEMDDEEIFFLPDDFIAEDEDALANPTIRYSPPRLYTREQNCALNDIMQKNDCLATKVVPPPKEVTVKPEAPTRKTVVVSTVYL